MIDVGRDFQRMQDYIVGRLSDDEHRAFEDRLQRDPGLVREFEQSLRLHEGLQQLREQGEFLRAAPVRSALRIWRPILAAALLVGVALFLRAQLMPVAPPLLTASIEAPLGGSAPPVAAHFTFVAMRGSSTPDLVLPSAGVIEFRAAPAVPATTYRMVLARGDTGFATPLGALRGATLGSDGYVHGYVDALRLKAGRYVLSVVDESRADAATESFPFNLRERADP